MKSLPFCFNYPIECTFYNTYRNGNVGMTNCRIAPTSYQTKNNNNGDYSIIYIYINICIKLFQIQLFNVTFQIQLQRTKHINR